MRIAERYLGMFPRDGLMRLACCNAYSRPTPQLRDKIDISPATHNCEISTAASIGRSCRDLQSSSLFVHSMRAPHADSSISSSRSTNGLYRTLCNIGDRAFHRSHVPIDISSRIISINRTRKEAAPWLTYENVILRTLLLLLLVSVNEIDFRSKSNAKKNKRDKRIRLTIN